MYLIGMVAVLVRGWKEIGNVSYSARSYLVDLLSILFSISDLALLSSCQIESCLQNRYCNQCSLPRSSLLEWLQLLSYVGGRRQSSLV